MALPVYNNALLILVNSNQATLYIHIPRQVPKEEVLKLFPETWVTNYEKLHQESAPIQSLELIFFKQKDGTVEITFKKTDSTSISPFKLFLVRMMMIHPLEYEKIPIEVFTQMGVAIYAFKKDSHIF